MFYKVYVADNYNGFDDEPLPVEASFDEYADAVVHCQAIINEWLADELAKGRDVAELAIHYSAFGPDPYILPRADGVPRFSSQQYAASASARLKRGG